VDEAVFEFVLDVVEDVFALLLYEPLIFFFGKLQLESFVVHSFIWIVEEIVFLHLLRSRMQLV